MTLPSLDPGPACEYCGGACPVEGYCDVCADRIADEQRREHSNDYRRQAQFRLDMENVKTRVRRYLRGEK